MKNKLETRIEGDRIVLRPVREDEFDAYFGLLQDAESNRLTGTQQAFTKDSIAAWIHKIGYAHEDRLDMMIAEKETDGLIGEVVLNEINLNNRSCNIRISISGQHSNKGYGTEAMKLMLRHGFESLRLHRIELGVYAFNPRAIHVYEKLGFKREGILRDSISWDGRFHDMILMSILEEEYRQLP